MILEAHSGTSTPASSTSGTSAERPAHHVVNPITGSLSFKNPWPSASAPTASELLFGGSWLGWPKLHLNKHPKARELQVLDVGDFGQAKVRELKETARKVGKGDKVGFARATWLGHAGMFVQIPLDTAVDPVSVFRTPSKSGEAAAPFDAMQSAAQDGSTLHLLFDPIFSERAGPTSYTGPGRIRASPCSVEDLPRVDAVLISHNHYDHLDANSIKSLIERFPQAHYFVPLGNKSWFNATGVPLSLIHELDWWDEVELSPEDFGIGPTKLASPFPAMSLPASFGVTAPVSSAASSSETVQDSERIRFSCVPAQHNSGRSPGDQGSTLWCGWVVEYFIDYATPTPTSPKTKVKRQPDPDATPTLASQAEYSDDKNNVVPPVLVEEPEEELPESAVVDDEDGDDDEADPHIYLTGRNLPRSVQLNVPDQGHSPDASSTPTPTESLSDLSIDTNESIHSDDSKARRRKSSVSQFLHRSASFSKQVSRRLSLSRSKDRSGNADRSASLPVSNEPSLDAPPRPRMSRSNSLRVARELQREQEALAAGPLSVPDSNTDGTRSAPPATGDKAANSLGSEDPEERARLIRETEAELARVRDEKKRQRALRDEREASERERISARGGQTKRVTRKGAIFHAGDTGYRRHRRCVQPVCPAFDEIGDRFGPFDLSFIPIWRGGSLGFVSAIGLRLHHENISSAVHGCPADAVDIHLDVRSRNSIGMHFGTFIGAESESLEAIIELAEAVEDAGVKALDDPNEDELGRMGVIDIGETWCTEIHPLLIVAA